MGRAAGPPRSLRELRTPPPRPAGRTIGERRAPVDDPAPKRAVGPKRSLAPSRSRVLGHTRPQRMSPGFAPIWVAEPTPPSRTIVVSAQDRTVAVSFVDRTVVA